MKGLRSILSLMGLALAAGLLAGCAGFGPLQEPPQVSLADLGLQDMGLFEQRYRLRLRVQNPNDVPIRINGMDYVLRINGREFARGVSARSATVPAYGEELIDVEAVSNLMSMLNQFEGLMGGQGGGLRYRLSGGLSLSNAPGKVPFDYQGEIAFGGGTATSESL